MASTGYTSATPESIARGNRIRLLREEHNMTQAELAVELGISRGYLGCLERGEIQNPRLQIYTDICKLFGVSLDYLLFGKSMENDAYRKSVQEAIEILKLMEESMSANSGN